MLDQNAGLVKWATSYVLCKQAFSIFFFFERASLGFFFLINLIN